jgi:hypothetical protein
VIAPGAKRKVIGVGLPKTGTTTLGRCFDILGYRHASFDFEAFEAYVNRDAAKAMAKMKNFDAFEDSPWYMMYREFDAQYPDCKFVLTTRRDAALWLRSGASHDARENADGSAASKSRDLFVRFYRDKGVSFDKPEEVYDFHNCQVQEHFSGRENKLLTVCWENGDAWETLCGFLGVAAPKDLAFPHENASPAERAATYE